MNKEDRLKIGEIVYNRKLSRFKASKKYNLNPYTIRDYMREYRDYNNLPPSNKRKVNR